MTAVRMNGLLGRRGTFWERGGLSLCLLTTDEAILKAHAYIRLNAVAAGLEVPGQESMYAAFGLEKTTMSIPCPGGVWRKCRRDDDSLKPQKVEQLTLEPVRGISAARWPDVCEQAYQQELPTALKKAEGKKRPRRFPLNHIPPHKPRAQRFLFAGDPKSVAAARKEHFAFEDAVELSIARMTRTKAWAELPQQEVGLHRWFGAALATP